MASHKRNVPLNKTLLLGMILLCLASLTAGAAVAILFAANASEDAPTQRLMPPLVFIHGFKGSVLSDSQGGVRWITWL